MDYRAFSYEPLQPRHIRVLELTAPPQPSTIISFSYAWGSVQKPCQMLLNGQILNITETVHDIFQSRITADIDTRVWIDAICINQEDLVEKAAQVGLMGEIYSNAESTRVWLGLADPNTNLAIQFTKTLFSILPELKIGEPERLNHYYTIYPDGCPEWQALAHLLNRPWFTRTWVIQEVALATYADIVCGDAVLTWDVLETVMVGLNDLGFDGLVYTTTATDSTEPVLMKGAPGHDALLGLAFLRTLVKAGKPRPILRVMATFQDSLTTEPNDKIYAVLGLATDVDYPVFYPDYTKSPEALFKDITMSLIKRDANLDSLRYAGLERGSGASLKSSWSINYSSAKDFPIRIGHYPITTAEKPEFILSDNNNRLSLRGYIFDKVCQLGIICGSYEEGQTVGKDKSSNYVDWFHQARLIAQSTGRNEEVLWRTLLANRITDTKNYSLDVSTEKTPDQSWQRLFKAFESIYGLPLGKSAEEVRQLITSHEGVEAIKYRGQMSRAIASRRFCVLSSGSLGLMPSEAQLNDVVAAFLGASVLFVIRPLPGDGDGDLTYELVGECYVHDSMDGQVTDLGLESQDIVLV
ncbi:Heterokaryon incompatibility protein [Hyphodiscus hymeniophilus]|uniref:Heterokaryon incompatibility protein n=1 Tax=Hyphodiscus hymeniophilus TaxID=353542 RepID=A0A9P6VKN9_9HELO|nr:Heterokaryon incompatibility protein [Hyphodiscus hymeniophilus]